MKNVRSEKFLAALVSCAAIHLSNGNLVTVINPLDRELIATETQGDFISPADMQLLIDEVGDRTVAGVFDCEAATSGSMTGVEADYDLPGLTIGGINRYGRTEQRVVDNNGTTSGVNFGFVATTATWTLVPKEDGDLITHFSTIFSQWSNGADLTTVTATFTDDTTATFTSETVYEGTASNQFVGFQAPAGLGIRSIDILEAAGGDWIAFDDVAFVINGRRIDADQGDASIAAVRVAGSTAEIDYVGVPELFYALEYSSDLQSWEEVVDGLTGNGTVTDDLVERLEVLPVKGFYRLRESDPPAN